MTDELEEIEPDVAELVEVIAGTGAWDRWTDGAKRKFRDALVRLIDERIEGRISQLTIDEIV